MLLRTGSAGYPEVPERPSYPALEQETLDYWERDETFAASIEQRSKAAELVFYDGPPFANGMPHYGHLLTGFVKDAIPGYATMRGKRVERRFGWDCHGLPAEIEAERELGVSGRGAIASYGIDRFNDYCRSSVLRYRAAWERYVTRQGRWVDFANDYKTMDITFMESVLWAFKSFHERGLIYEGHRVLPYCWECETPLSNFETRQDDAYRDRVDPAVTVAFRLAADAGASGPAAGPLSVLVWTTTPWTLPSNLALAVGADLQYSIYQKDGQRWLIAAARAAAYHEELAEFELVGQILGAELVGRSYQPIFSYFAETPKAFVVLGAEFVTTDEGTGIVHLAPGFGEDDQAVCEANGIAVICPVDDRGCFEAAVTDFAGSQVFAANPLIVEALGALGVLVRVEEYRHSYPHCWRSDTPLIYRAVGSFFVEVTKIKSRMVELNKSIDWVPSHVGENGFAKWLEGARDWSISRNRFWGTPIPVWKSDDPAYPRIDVYGSLDELEADFGVRPVDLHRPAIDQLTRPNPDDPTGKSTMVRVTDVLDCWFDSGSMPFAQLHYPFENAERFESHFPADFICEYVGQTRGWFYTLHIFATALFDRPAFSHCIAHGVVLGNDGRKLSKRLRNFPDPEEFFASEGADAMRWFLLSSPVLRGQDVVIEEHAMSEPVRQVLNPIWNSWRLLSIYGRIDDVRGERRSDAASVLDRYVLAKTRLLVDTVTEALDHYEPANAASAVVLFLDALTNWYVRRSRERFWRPIGESPEGDKDKADAYDTLHTVLVTLAETVAPLLPFLAENLYRGITGGRSVHLADWPDAEQLPNDRELVVAMDLVREVCSAAHSIRKAEGRRARLPLRRIVIAGREAELLAPFVGLIADEVNVKQVDLVPELEGRAVERLTVVPATLGPRLGPRTQQVIAATRNGDWQQRPDGVVVAAGIELFDGEFTIGLVPVDASSSRVLGGKVAVVSLDLEVTADLAAEGSCRDLVRFVQQFRKDLALEVTDLIELRLGISEALGEALGRWNPSWPDELARQTLASAVVVDTLEAVRGGRRETLPDGTVVQIAIRRADSSSETED